MPSRDWFPPHCDPRLLDILTGKQLWWSFVVVDGIKSVLIDVGVSFPYMVCLCHCLRYTMQDNTALRPVYYRTLCFLVLNCGCMLCCCSAAMWFDSVTEKHEVVVLIVVVVWTIQDGNYTVFISYLLSMLFCMQRVKANTET